MSIEAFLHFWSQHNTAIIESLIALILSTVLYLAYRSFFGVDVAAAHAEGVPFDQAQLEKTLKKVLGSTPVMAAAPAEGGHAGASAGATSDAEVSKLRAELADRNVLVEQLQKAATTADGSSLPAISLEEKRAWEDKTKHLELRLAEYEIISEDIADLSFYKEENAKLKAELAALRESMGQTVAAEAAPASAPAAAVPQAADAMSEMDIASLLSGPIAAEPVVDAAAASVVPEVNDSGALSDPAGAPEVSLEESQLMNQFEKFVKKG